MLRTKKIVSGLLTLVMALSAIVMPVSAADVSVEIVLEPTYREVGSFYDGALIVSDQNFKKGIIDATGKVLVEPKYEWLNPYSDGIATFKENGYYGAFDTQGNIVIQPNKYTHIDSFENGKASANYTGGTDFGCVIDKAGNVIRDYTDYGQGDYDIEREQFDAKYGSQGYSLSDNLGDNLYVVYDNTGNRVVIDGSLHVLISSFVNIEVLGSDRLGVRKTYDTNVALFDISGNQLTEYVYKEIRSFNAGYAVATKADNTQVYLGTDGVELTVESPDATKPVVTFLSDFNKNGIAVVFAYNGEEKVKNQKSTVFCITNTAKDGKFSVLAGTENLNFRGGDTKAEEFTIGRRYVCISDENCIVFSQKNLQNYGFMRVNVPTTPAPGTPMGDVLYTDIVAYIDDKPIRSYNIAGNTYIVVEDLTAYGFDVQWIAKGSGKLVVGTTRTATPDGYTTTYVPEKNTHPAGSVAMQYLYTNITAWLGDTQVTGYNIGGYTCIGMDDLAAAFATNYVWDGTEGALRLYTQP